MYTKKEYREFLESDLWKYLKKQYKKKECCICGSKEKLALHHLDYSKDGLNVKKFRTVCNRCHKKIHFTRKGKKRTIGESLKMFGLLKKWVSDTSRRKIAKEFYTPINNIKNNYRELEQIMNSEFRGVCS